MRILVLRSFLVNIGNGIIDNGANACIKNTFPNSEIFEASCYSNWVADEKSKSGLKNFVRLISGIGTDELLNPFSVIRENVVNIGEYINADLVILPGLTLNDYILIKILKTLNKIKSRGIPLIFLGAGGNYYSEKKVRTVKRLLNQLQPAGLISRDELAFKYYSEQFKYTAAGIDCGFFINDWYIPPASIDKFIVLAFDKIKEPNIDTRYKKIRALHLPFDFPFRGKLLRNTKETRRSSKGRFYEKENFFISDSVKDYLFLYKNAVETHSDRVHACVSALSYGNKARLYFKTPRMKLFDNLVKGDFEDDFLSIDHIKVKREKNNQMKSLKEIAEEAVK